MQTITVHKPECPAAGCRDGLHVVIKDLRALVPEVHGFMERYGIPFYRVQPHNSECPGCHFPWEDLEFQLFTLEH